MDHAEHHDLKKGVLLCLFAWFCFSSLYTVSKLLGDHTSVPTILFFRNVFGFIIVLPWLRSFKVKNPKLIVVRSLSGLFSLFFVILSIQTISLVDATLLNNAAPLIVPFVVWIWLRIPLQLKVWPASIVGFIGVALILQPTKMIFNLGAFYAFLSAISLAISLVTTRVGTRHESFATFMFYFFGIGLLITTPFAIAYWKVDNWLTLLGLLSIGLFSALGQVGIFNGLKFGKARQLAPISYAAVLFSGIYEWLIWGIVPAPMFYVGMVLIVAAGLWIVFESRPTKNV